VRCRPRIRTYPKTCLHRAGYIDGLVGTGRTGHQAPSPKSTNSNVFPVRPSVFFFAVGLPILYSSGTA